MYLPSPKLKERDKSSTIVDVFCSHFPAMHADARKRQVLFGLSDCSRRQPNINAYFLYVGRRSYSSSFLRKFCSQCEKF